MVASFPPPSSEFLGSRDDDRSKHLDAVTGAAGRFPFVSLSITYYTLNLTETVGGTTSPAPGLIPVVSGNNVTISGTANPHYSFDHWQLDNTQDEPTNPIFLSMTTNHTLRAIFVPLPNFPPKLSVPGAQVASEGSTLSFKVNASDPDSGETINISILGLPSGAAFDPVTGDFTSGNPLRGVFSWAPMEGQGPANYLVKFVATDDGAPPLSDEATVAIHVDEANLPPSLNVPWRRTINEGQTLNFAIDASDPDIPQETLTLSAVSLPLGAAFNNLTGAFSWTPTLVQAPGNYTVTFQVSDGILTDSKSVMILVNSVNQPPVMSVPATQTVEPGAPLIFSIIATDPDLPPETIVLSASGLPQGASFDPGSGLFSWTPNPAQGPGVYNVAFTAADDHGGVVTHRVTINVSRATFTTSSLPPLTGWGALWYVPIGVVIAEVLAFGILWRRKRRGGTRGNRTGLGTQV